MLVLSEDNYEREKWHQNWRPHPPTEAVQNRSRDSFSSQFRGCCVQFLQEQWPLVCCCGTEWCKLSSSHQSTTAGRYVSAGVMGCSPGLPVSNYWDRLFFFPT